MCAGLRGDVLEIGYGSGLNQPHLPPAVTGVWAIEPSVTAIRLGAGAAGGVPGPGRGRRRRRTGRCPSPTTGSMPRCAPGCSAASPIPGAALAEVARVLKPGGALHFVEHGLAPDPGVVRWQRRGNRINRAVSGCVLDNDVRALLEPRR